jgi:hypothetical protein
MCRLSRFEYVFSLVEREWALFQEFLKICHMKPRFVMKLTVLPFPRSRVRRVASGFQPLAPANPVIEGAIASVPALFDRAAHSNFSVLAHYVTP